MDEWTQLGQELLETNPQTYRKMVAILRELVEAEKQVAAPEIGIMLELLRARIPST
jgi:hypothetical protein